MKKVFTLFVAMVAIAATALWAGEEKYDAIFVWIDGDSTCYQLAQHPRVIYQENAAILMINNIEQLRLTLQNKAKLKITYGKYVPTAITDVSSSPVVRQDGKIISGGRLIIIHHGKQYDIKGNVIQ